MIGIGMPSSQRRMGIFVPPFGDCYRQMGSGLHYSRRQLSRRPFVAQITPFCLGATVRRRRNAILPSYGASPCCIFSASQYRSALTLKFLLIGGAPERIREVKTASLSSSWPHTANSSPVT
jgi:hypothetical protein